MYDVVVYLSSLPRIADRHRKVQVLKAFAEGARHCGARVFVQDQPDVIDCKLAVILGWVGTSIKGPHIQLRKDVIQRQRQTGRHVMPIDSSCFKFADPDSVFLRYSLDSVFYRTANYANANSNSDRWQQIQSTLSIDLKPWRTNGNHILVCLQRDGGWSMKGVDLNRWTNDTVRQLRQYTTRPIVIRPHPKYPVNLKELLTLPKVSESRPTETLQQNLENAWASVFYNSSSSVASVLAGVPIFVHDDDCVAWEVANQDLSQIEYPNLPQREQWLYNLSAAHWTDADSRSGEIYRKFLPFI